MINPECRASPEVAASCLRLARPLICLIVLACLMAISQYASPAAGHGWSDYVRVAPADQSELALPTASDAPAIQHAGWAWDIIDILDDYLAIGNEEDDDDEERGEDDEADDEGGQEDDGDGDGGDNDGDGDGEGDGGTGDGEGDGGTGDGEGDGGDQQQSSASAPTRSDVIDAIDTVGDYFDEDYGIDEETPEEELMLFIADLLEFLYDYVE